MRTLAITTSAAPPTDFTKKLCHIFYAPTSRFLITEVSIRGIPTMVLLRPTKLLFQLAGDLVEGSAGAGFILFTAGGAADPEGADRLFADLDDDRPLQQQHVRHFEEELRRRRGLGAFGACTTRSK
jgi:hypothetical protein